MTSNIDVVGRAVPDNNNTTLWPNLQVDLQAGTQPKLSSKLGRVWQPEEGEPPTKIYQKDVFNRPRILHMDLTHKIKIRLHLS